MNKEQYLSDLALLKADIKEKTESIQILKKYYIDKNRPCEVGDNVEIVLASGRKVKGEVKSFQIMNDKMVYVNSYKSDEGMKYISIPYIKLTVLNQ